MRKELEARGLHPEIGAMSTQAAVVAEEAFAASRDAFIRIRPRGFFSRSPVIDMPAPKQHVPQ